MKESNKDCNYTMRDNTLMIIVVILLVFGAVYYFQHHQVSMDVKDDNGNKSHMTIKHN